jgi:hypothetical protein
MTFGEVTDPISDTVLSDAVYYYRTGSSFERYDTLSNADVQGPFSAGDTVTISNDETVHYHIYRTGYDPLISSTSITAESFVSVSPESGTYWGESLTLTVNSNRFTVDWSSTNGESATKNGQITESGSRTIELNDSFAKRDNDTVTITFTTSDGVDFEYQYYRRKLGAPVLTPAPSGSSDTVYFTGSDAVTIDRSGSSSAGTVYYELEDKTPTINSTVYSGTIDIDSDTTVSARVIADDSWLPSDVVTYTYIRQVDFGEGAAYFDADGDGYIDSGWINVDVFIEPDAVVLKNLDGTDSAAVIVGTKLIKNVAESRYEFRLSSDEQLQNSTTGFESGDYIYMVGVNYNTSVTTVDEVAPVISSASVIPKGSDINNVAADTLDRLYVTFSEAMSLTSLSTTNPFILTNGGGIGVVTPVTDGNVTDMGDNEYLFYISSWGTNVSGQTVTYPLDGDSLHINTEAGVADSKDVSQEVTTNRRVTLDVEPRPVELRIFSSFGRKDSDLRQASTPLSSPSPYLEIDSGVTLLLDPVTEMGTEQVEGIKIDVIIYDVAGHVVAEGRGEAGGIIQRDNILAQPAILAVPDVEDPTKIVNRIGVAMIWTGKNNDGRVTGPGAYKVILYTEWPGGVQKNIQALVQVVQ